MVILSCNFLVVVWVLHLYNEEYLPPKGYGAQSAEEKQRLFKLMRNLNFNGESGAEPYTPTAQSLGGTVASDGFYSPEFRGDFGAGLLDLHAMDDTELLSEVSS